MQENQAQPYDSLSTQGGVHTPPEGLCLNLFPPQEEMYIFMEYCDEGTLEEVSRLGLQEHVIRLYSKQITVAINVLHDHGIVHRDIKGTPHRASTGSLLVSAPVPTCYFRWLHLCFKPRNGSEPRCPCMSRKSSLSPAQTASETVFLEMKCAAASGCVVWFSLCWLHAWDKAPLPNPCQGLCAFMSKCVL